jgi:hypothetical protein
MKAVIRRLHRLERRLAPHATAESDQSLRVAIMIRERRRHRLEANGEPFEELPLQPVPHMSGRHLTIAETLRLGRQRLRAESPCGDFGRCEIATDNRK